MNVYAYGNPLAEVKAREVCVSGKPDYHAPQGAWNGIPKADCSASVGDHIWMCASTCASLPEPLQHEPQRHLPRLGVGTAVLLTGAHPGCTDGPVRLWSYVLQVCVVQFSNDTRVEFPLGPLDKPAFDTAVKGMVRAADAVHSSVVVSTCAA